METEVRLFQESWVPNARAEAYFGPIKANVFVVDRRQGDRVMAWELAEERLEAKMRAAARACGAGDANAVVGVEVTWDPWHRPEGSARSGLMLVATGTAAKLVRLFADVPY